MLAVEPTGQRDSVANVSEQNVLEAVKITPSVSQKPSDFLTNISVYLENKTKYA